MAELEPSLRERARRLRRFAHGQLVRWATDREWALQELGWPALSICARIKIERDGLSQRSTAPGELSLLERQAERWGRVLQVERVVRDMPVEWKVVIEAVYLNGKSQASAAAALGIDRERAVYRLQDAQERLAALLDGWQAPMEAAA